MSAITGGLVFVEDGTKSEQEFTPARRVRVELRFDVAEGASSAEQAKAITTTGDIASAEVDRLLGRTVTRATGDVKAGDKIGTTTVVAVKEPEAPAAEKPARKPRASKDKTEGQNSSTDPLAGMGEAQAPAAQPQSETSTDPLADLLGQPEPPAEVTDADLNAAVQAKIKVFNNPPAIRAYVGTFGVKLLAEIPQAKRAEFLTGLDKLA